MVYNLIGDYMMERTNKTTIVVLIIFTIYVFAAFGYNLWQRNVFQTFPEIEWNKHDNIYQNDDIYSYDLIKNIKYGKIVSPNEKIDTSVPTKKNIHYIIENKYGKRDIKIITIKINKKS